MIAKQPTRKIYLALPLLIVGTFSVNILYAQLSNIRTVAAQPDGKKAEQLVGSWVITVTAIVPPGVPSPPVRTNYTTFAFGGTAIGSDRLAPFANPQHGAWEYLGGNDFIWTFIADNFVVTGNFLGTLKVRAKITMTSPDTFISVDNAEVRDPSGNLLFSACNTLRGTRINVEPVPPQCQGIIPPQ